MSESGHAAEETAYDDRYSGAAQTLHWLSAVLMFFVVPCAWYMTSLTRGDPALAEWQGMHESAGMLILFLSAVHLLWRSFAPPPPMAGQRQPWEKILAEATHGLLYVVLLIMPLSGYIGSVAGGRPVTFFAIGAFPSLVPADKEIAHLAHLVHEAGQWAVYALVAMHMAVAGFHALVRRDGVIRRMLPARPAKR